jgi:hypothetical protein
LNKIEIKSNKNAKIHAWRRGMRISVKLEAAVVEGSVATVMTDVFRKNGIMVSRKLLKP